MILLIDAGNSRLKAGLLPPGAQRRLPETRAFDHADPLALALRRGLVAHREAVLDGGWTRK